MTPFLCACAVVITLETQKCRKRAPRSVEFNFFINCDRHKRFSQNERRRISSIVKGVSEPLNYLVIIIAGGWLLGSFEKKRKREIEIDRDRERASQRE